MSTSILYCVGGAAALGQLARTEASAIEGSRGTFTGMIQAASVYEALWFLNQAFSLAGYTPLPSLACRAIYVVPVAISYAVGKRIQTGWVREPLVFIQDHLNKLCHVVAAVSCVVLIYFGSVVAGTVGLIVLGLGVCERNQVVGPKPREWMRTYFDPVMATIGFCSADWFNRALFAADFASHWMATSDAENEVVPEVTGNVLSIEKMGTLLPRLDRFRGTYQEYYAACATGCRVHHLTKMPEPAQSNRWIRWFNWAWYGSADKGLVNARNIETHEVVDFEAIDDWISVTGIHDIRALISDPGIEKDGLRSIFSGFGAVNRSYVHTNPVPPADSSVKFTELADMVDAAEKKELLQRLKLQLVDDEKYAEAHGNVQQPDDELLTQYVSNLRTCLTNIENEAVGDLTKKDHRWIKDNLRILIKALRTLSPQDRIDHLVLCLARLPYCGSGKKDFVETMVGSLILHQPQTPFRIKILQLLRQERMHWFAVTLNRFVNHRFSSSELLHEHNRLLQMYGAKKLGIMSASAENDELAKIPPLLYPMSKHLIQPLWHHKFWLDHVPSALVNAIAENIGEGKPISFHELKIVWHQWINRQKIEEAEKSRLRRGYDSYHFLGVDVDLDGKYNPALIYALLIDMGIIEVPR